MLKQWWSYSDVGLFCSRRGRALWVRFLGDVIDDEFSICCNFSSGLDPVQKCEIKLHLVTLQMLLSKVTYRCSAKLEQINMRREMAFTIIELVFLFLIFKAAVQALG